MTTVTLDWSDALTARHALRRTMDTSQRELRSIEREERDGFYKAETAVYLTSYYSDDYCEAHALYLEINRQLDLGE